MAGSKSNISVLDLQRKWQFQLLGPWICHVVWSTVLKDGFGYELFSLKKNTWNCLLYVVLSLLRTVSKQCDRKRCREKSTSFKMFNIPCPLWRVRYLFYSVLIPVLIRTFLTFFNNLFWLAWPGWSCIILSLVLEKLKDQRRRTKLLQTQPSSISFWSMGRISDPLVIPLATEHRLARRI